MNIWDGGRIIALVGLLTPFYSPLMAAREEGGMLYHYRLGYVFGIRIFRYQLMYAIGQDDTE